MGCAPAADIGFAHDGVGHHLLRRAIADDPAVVQHDQPAAGAHDLFEIVLHQNDGNALGIHGDDGFNLLARLRSD